MPRRRNSPGVGTAARTVRGSLPEWDEWQARADAQGLPRNRWIRQTLNDGAQLERTLEKMRQREQAKAAPRRSHDG